VKTRIIALSAAVLIAAAPAVFAKNVSSKTPSMQHKVSKKHHPAVTNYALRREGRSKVGRRGIRELSVTRRAPPQLSEI
jgi:hypothetical protein